MAARDMSPESRFFDGDTESSNESAAETWTEQRKSPMSCFFDGDNFFNESSNAAAAETWTEQPMPEAGSSSTLDYLPCPNCFRLLCGGLICQNCTVGPPKPPEFLSESQRVTWRESLTVYRQGNVLVIESKQPPEPESKQPPEPESKQPPEPESKQPPEPESKQPQSSRAQSIAARKKKAEASWREATLEARLEGPKDVFVDLSKLRPRHG